MVPELVRRSAPMAPVAARLMVGGMMIVHRSVIDSGEGIAPDEIHRIFDRFYRGRNARGDGSGLGTGDRSSHRTSLWRRCRRVQRARAGNELHTGAPDRHGVTPHRNEP